MRTSLIFSLVFTAANALTITPRQSSISWKPCLGDNLECGSFQVPLDYADPTAGMATLALLRYRSTSPSKLGTIFTNPGGPGESGVSFLSGSGSLLSGLVHGQYDIVSWDPRGVNQSEPLIKCFDNVQDAAPFLSTFASLQGIEARGNFTDQADLDVLNSKTEEINVAVSTWFSLCDSKSGGRLKYIGTAAVVRDMVAMADVLEGPEKPINYWGFSYGTIIGSYFVNMFPNRVGRVILDGVVSPEQWANTLPHSTWGETIQDAEPTLEGFALLCSQAGPNHCALASSGSTSTSILARIHSLVDKAYDAHKAGFTDAKSSDLRAFLFNALYNPKNWPAVAKQLVELDQQLSQALAGGKVTTRSIKSLLKRQQGEQGDQIEVIFKKLVQQSALTAITCADAIDSFQVTTTDIINEVIETTRQVSSLFGPMFANAGFFCHLWMSRAVERFQGPWNNQLLNPILVIGNKGDPVTPLASAKFVAESLGNSAILIEMEGYGHTSLYMGGPCTFQAIGNYFVNGTLPTQDIICDANLGTFTSTNSTNSSTDSRNDTSTSTTNNNSGHSRTGWPTLTTIYASATLLIVMIMTWEY